MRLSRSALLAPVPGRTETLLVQPLSGQVALLGEAEARALRGLAAGAALPSTLDESALRQARFLVDSDDEDRALHAEAWAGWLEEVERTPTQLVLVPTFGCNLRCAYCYQEVFDPAARGLVAPEVLDAFFAYVEARHASDSPRPYLTLFGGEPLVDTPAHRDRLRRVLDGARAARLTVAAVTNGYDLEAFADELHAGPVKEVQVTLDGPREVHDARRPHGTGRGTFDRAVRGVEALVAREIPVNLRVVVDGDNLRHLPALARLALERGWLDLPESRFKTQIGRNYELFGCASGQRRDALLDRVELWARYAELAEAHPELRRFHLPRFHGIRHLAETGELPVANFDACPAGKKEWAFAPDGGLYGCTATVGNPRYRLGSFWPEIRIDEAALEPWRTRSVATIERCATCEAAAVCGGGCGALADAQGLGIHGPDCRPVKELFGIGARFYRLAETA
ncbi:MAG TPA: radical SAM protein [Anaeromyxobacteraceae bacterium]|nr:radical SAM protein [Anaeromyxobacteraceae bacterium]